MKRPAPRGTGLRAAGTAFRSGAVDVTLSISSRAPRRARHRRRRRCRPVGASCSSRTTSLGRASLTRKHRSAQQLVTGAPGRVRGSDQRTGPRSSRPTREQGRRRRRGYDQAAIRPGVPRAFTRGIASAGLPACHRACHPIQPAPTRGTSLRGAARCCDAGRGNVMTPTFRLAGRAGILSGSSERAPVELTEPARQGQAREA
jgi:hypothetical protein